jgi:predicted phosphoribosyltransferase
MGAIATGGVRVLNEEVIGRTGISDQVIEAVSAREQDELRRRELAYRGHAPPPQVSGKTIILVDDGIATGSTMRAAIAALRQQCPSKLVIAVPTAAPSSGDELRPIADEVVAVMMPEPFYAVGQWYATFNQHPTKKFGSFSNDHGIGNYGPRTYLGKLPNPARPPTNHVII